MEEESSYLEERETKSRDKASIHPMHEKKMAIERRRIGRKKVRNNSPPYVYAHAHARVREGERERVGRERERRERVQERKWQQRDMEMGFSIVWCGERREKGKMRVERQEEGEMREMIEMKSEEGEEEALIRQHKHACVRVREKEMEKKMEMRKENMNRSRGRQRGR